MSERVPAGGPFRAAAGLHESLSLEHVLEAKRLLSSYCPGRFCRDLVSRLEDTSVRVAEARLTDLLRERDYTGIDSDIVGAVRQLVEWYARYIAGFYSTHGENVIVAVKATIEVDGALLEPGEVVRLPPGKAARLHLAGLAEPLTETSVKLAASLGGEGAGEGGEK